MSGKSFEASFRIKLDRETVWRRLTDKPAGIHARRFERSWSDLGADTMTDDGGIRLDGVRPGGLANRLGIHDGDLLITVANTPVTTVDELLTVLRVLDTTSAGDPAAEWIRDGELHTAS